MADDLLDDPELYLDREVSLLAFNRRVLAQATDPDVPLLERLRFLTITATNMDEFFEVRVAGLKQRLSLGLRPLGPTNKPPARILERVGERAHALIREQYRVLNDDLIPALEAARVRFLRRGTWPPAVRDWLAHYFATELEPVLSPIGLDPAHPFPRILNKSLNFLVTLSGRDAFGRDAAYAVVQAPRALPRLVQLPHDLPDAGPHDFVFLSSIIHAHVDSLFPGMTVSGCYQFRVTRDSELYFDEEEVDDLLKALRVELGTRRYGSAVRLEVTAQCPAKHARFLLRHFELDEADLYSVPGPVNLGRLSAVVDLVDRPELKWPAFTPAVPRDLREGADYFAAVRAGDILLHHPYESFAPLLEFLRQAARDPGVLAIKQTLYRTGPRSPVVDILVEAANAGKEVTVVIELRARFDEAENIELAARLQEAGAHVVYGVVGHKTHAKLLLIVRRENGELRRYVHLGTGNYHPDTTRLYCDYGLLSADAELGQDVHNLFMGLTGLGHVKRMNKLVESPFTLRDELLRLIAREAEHARAGRRARIIVKANGLTEPGTIRALYEAARAGVDIALIVRGMCCLRPGVPGVSDRIRVRSIVGRFLEHSRVYYFYNGGEPSLYLASADLMERNLFRRVEAAFPVESDRLRRRILKELALYLRDNRQAWLLGPDGSWRAAHPRGRSVRRAQEELLRRLAAERPDISTPPPSSPPSPAARTRAPDRPRSAGARRATRTGKRAPGGANRRGP